MSTREIKTLKAHWSHALDAALDAVEAGRAAETLTPAFCTVEIRRIKGERQWLETTRWP